MYSVGMEIDFKDIALFEKALERSRIKETISADVVARRMREEHKEEKDALKLVIKRYEEEMTILRKDSETREKRLLESYQTQLVACNNWQKAYEELEKNFETQKEIIKSKLYGNK